MAGLYETLGQLYGIPWYLRVLSSVKVLIYLRPPLNRGYLTAFVSYVRFMSRDWVTLISSSETKVDIVISAIYQHVNAAVVLIVLLCN